MAEKNLQIQELAVDDLETGMTITAYSRFSTRYQPMDKATAAFIRINFKNSRAIVSRNHRKLTVPISKIKAGDSLHKISNIPKNLKKLTVVANQRFVHELKKRGMIGFQIQGTAQTQSRKRAAARSQVDMKEMLRLVNMETEKQPKKKLTVKQEHKRKLASIANTLISSVRESQEKRDSAISAVQDTMNRVRRGSVDFNQLKREIKNIGDPPTMKGIAASIGLKTGDPIYTHSIDVGAIYHRTYFRILEKSGKRSKFKSKEHALLGSVLHDIGKSKIPKDLLENNNVFQKNSREMQIVRSHPYFGAELLSHMGMPDSIVGMARNHHVKKNTEMLSSYPSEVAFDSVDFETRLLAIVDIYQAFVGKRKYKKSWSAPATMRYLDALAGIEYDAQIWEKFLNIVGIYPEGSLVMLNDNSLAFVMNVPERINDMEKPLVAVVRNSKGENLSHNDLIDLKVEKDISIVKDLLSDELFGDEVFNNFARINVG